MQLTEEGKADLYRDYSGKVYGYIYNKINNAHEAEDLVSEVFLKVYQKLDSFDESKASVSTWIFTITRNTLIDFYRTRKVGEELPEELSEDSSVLEDICKEESLKALAKALERLSMKEKTLIVKHYYSNESLKDIAEEMDISYSYAKLLHSQALEKLKKLL